MMTTIKLANGRVLPDPETVLLPVPVDQSPVLAKAIDMARQVLDGEAPADMPYEEAVHFRVVLLQTALRLSLELHRHQTSRKAAGRQEPVS